MLDNHKKIHKLMEDVVAGDTTGHDIHHLERVYNIGLRIADSEGGDKNIIGAACLTHDMHRILGDGNYISPVNSLPYVENILREANFDRDKINRVLYCVEMHENYSFEENPIFTDNIEAEIVQDADNLDAMGAIGIGRCFMFSGAHGCSMWNPDQEFDDTAYNKEDIADSAMYHFHDKLLKLKDEMNTETAKKIAKDRHDFMQNYIERFKKEWYGEK